jgi:hypothetical protein
MAAALLLGGYIIFDKLYTGFISDPVQINLENGQTINITGDEGLVPITLLASYSIEAVVKSKNRMWDYPAQVSRYDLALAWGSLNNEAIDRYISYSQSNRFYYYYWKPGITVSSEYIGSHSANAHLIHSDKKILGEIQAIGKGDHIKLAGYLVKVNFPNGPWTSSLTRTDSGNGACEIIYVTNVEQLD